MNHYFDIGANNGTALRGYLSKTDAYDGWTVWCFEPSLRHIQPLLEEAKKHQGRYKVIVCACGVTGTASFTPFYPKHDQSADSFYYEHAPRNGVFGDDLGFTQFSAGVTLSHILETNTTENDQVEISIDSEGSEFDILANLLDNYHLIKRIIRLGVEWHVYAGTNHDMEHRAKLMDKFAELGCPIQYERI
jgi:FkbM family methyltransferase